MIVNIIRHGLTPLTKQKKVNGEIDEPLIPEGIEQAKSAITQIPKTVTTIYSSPLLRARETAEIIGTALKLPVSIANELTEIKMGSLAGKSWEEMPNGMELKKKHRTVKFDYRPYGGESLEEVKDRIITFFRKINNKYSDNEVLLITHGGMIRVITLLEKGESIYDTQEHASLLICDVEKILRN